MNFLLKKNKASAQAQITAWEGYAIPKHSFPISVSFEQTQGKIRQITLRILNKSICNLQENELDAFLQFLEDIESIEILFESTHHFPCKKPPNKMSVYIKKKIGVALVLLFIFACLYFSAMKSFPTNLMQGH